MLEYVIEGHDGSAKTPVSLGVKKRLENMSYSVGLYAPFQIVNAQIPEVDIYLYWKKDETTSKALTLLSDVIKSNREDAIKNNVDVVLYDRHWLTILGEIDHRENFKWNDFKPTFFLEAPVSKTMDCKRFSFDIPWTDSVDTIDSYYHKYLGLIEKYSEHVIDRYRVNTRTQPLDPIIDSITDYIVTDLTNGHNSSQKGLQIKGEKK